MRYIIFSILILILNIGTFYSQQTEIQYLSGIDADSPVDWEFKISKGRKANSWETISVPSNWELHGFGEYNYGHDKNKSDEIGFYKYNFSVSEEWSAKKIFIVFEGVMTDTEVKINSTVAGPIHQGGFYRFEYDITELVRFDSENLLEVKVKKVSDNSSVEIAERKSDYWVFGGIFRPVYLKILPNEHIQRTAIDAKADGSFNINVFHNRLVDANEIEAQIVQQNGLPLGERMSKKIGGDEQFTNMTTSVIGQNNWTAESPHLYFIDVLLKQDGKTIHTIRERFGFRTIEVREGEGIYLNESIITLKGCNRHSFWPETGRALSRNKCYDDIMLLKEMNMNAVRMSHYPPDNYFLDLCDEYGIYVLDEVAGWQKPAYDTPTSKRLIKQLVTRDVNHPSVLFWDNGNEGGWNLETDDEFAKYDPQKRRVLHPWELFGGIDTDHYENYESVENKMRGSNIFMPTEHLHGLYDGGHGAGLDDFWKLMWGNPLNGGMFLWVFADEGVIRTDKEWSIDTDGNHAPDGILGPFHEKEASFYTIKEIWSPIYIETDRETENKFNGMIPVENRYDFTNLKECSFNWQLVKYPLPQNPLSRNKLIASGSFQGPNVMPRESGHINMKFINEFESADALVLTGLNKFNEEVFTWKYKLKSNIEISKEIIIPRKGEVKVESNNEFIKLSSDNHHFSFSTKDGILQSVMNGSKKIPFNNGPMFRSSLIKGKVNENVKINSFNSDQGFVVDVQNHSKFKKLKWTIFSNGWLKLDYEYINYDSLDYMGVSFDYPEERMQSMKWLGKGPYRVWKNRLKGPMIDVWNNNYHNFKVNTKWDFPEFAGYYADFNWVVFSTLDGPITIVTESEDLFLRVYSQIDGEDPRNTKMIWPDGDISFLHSIPAIGTKFLSAEKLGPMSEKYVGGGEYKGTLFIYFGLPK